MQKSCSHLILANHPAPNHPRQPVTVPLISQSRVRVDLVALTKPRVALLQSRPSKISAKICKSNALWEREQREQQTLSPISGWAQETHRHILTLHKSLFRHYKYIINIYKFWPNLKTSLRRKKEDLNWSASVLDLVVFHSQPPWPYEA